MKYIQILIIILLISCKSNNSTKEHINSNIEEDVYHVYKIDSLRNYYLVYAKKNDGLFKIVSKKQKNNLEIIKIGSSYKFKLTPIGLSNVNKNDKVMNSLDRKNPCYKFSDSTEICLERYIGELYITKSLIGLSFDKNAKEIEPREISNW